MGGLPRQLPWRDFERALRKLGDTLHKSGPGSARRFFNPDRFPKQVTFHEAHGSDPIRPSTLRACIRQLDLSLDEFLKLLD